MTDQNQTLGMLFYRIEDDDGISRTDYSNMPGRYQLVNPVSLGEALRTSTSLKEPLRVERVGADYALLWLTKDEQGREVSSQQVRLYQGGDGSRQMYSMNRLTWPGCLNNLSIDEELVIARFESRVRQTIGTLPYSKVSSNAIEYAMTKCCATRIRKDGGTYFIPHYREETWLSYVGAWEAVGTKFFIVDVATTGRTILSISAGVREDLGDRVQDILERLDDIKRTGTIETRLTELTGVLELADLYESILQVKMDDLRTEVAVVRKVAAMRMGLLQAERK